LKGKKKKEHAFENIPFKQGGRGMMGIFPPKESRGHG
jgi:hypothetical protein